MMNKNKCLSGAAVAVATVGFGYLSAGCVPPNPPVLGVDSAEYAISGTNVTPLGTISIVLDHAGSLSQDFASGGDVTGSYVMNLNVTDAGTLLPEPISLTLEGELNYGGNLDYSTLHLQSGSNTITSCSSALAHQQGYDAQLEGNKADEWASSVLAAQGPNTQGAYAAAMGTPAPGNEPYDSVYAQVSAANALAAILVEKLIFDQALTDALDALITQYAACAATGDCLATYTNGDPEFDAWLAYLDASYNGEALPNAAFEDDVKTALSADTAAAIEADALAMADITAAVDAQVEELNENGTLLQLHLAGMQAVSDCAATLDPDCEAGIIAYNNIDGSGSGYSTPAFAAAIAEQLTCSNFGFGPKQYAGYKLSGILNVPKPINFDNLGTTFYDVSAVGAMSQLKTVLNFSFAGVTVPLSVTRTLTVTSLVQTP